MNKLKNESSIKTIDVIKRKKLDDRTIIFWLTGEI